jgi:protein phosphatase 1 regulatory subunit 7
MKENNESRIFASTPEKWLHIDSSCLDECLKYMYENNIKHIKIGGRVYKEKDISFLDDLKDYLEGLLIDADGYRYDVINKLHNLKIIGAEDNGKDVIDFSNFPNLEDCREFYFNKRQINIDSCKKLKFLRALKYKSKSGDLSELPFIPSLEVLKLLYVNATSLKGIERFSYLKAISLYRAHKLESLDDLISLSDVLEEFELEGKTKIFDYHALGKLRVVKRLFLNNVGDIKDLSFLETMPSLKHFAFMDSNVVDGDLSYCKKVNGWVAFTNKKHYSMTFEELHPEWVAEQRKRSKELDEKLALKEQESTPD